MTERPSCPTPARQPGSRSTSGVLLVAGLATVLLFFTANAVASCVRLQRLREMSGKESHTHEVIATLGDVRRLIKDAETGQRGRLITGNERYVELYEAAGARIDDRLNAAERLTADNPKQQARVAVLESKVALKQKYLAENIATRRNEGFEQLRQSVMTHCGQPRCHHQRSRPGRWQRHRPHA